MGNYKQSELDGVFKAKDGKLDIKRNCWSSCTGASKVKKGQLIEIIQIRAKTATKYLLSKLFYLARKSLYWQAKRVAKDKLLKNQILDCLAINPSYGHRRIALALGVDKKRDKGRPTPT